MQIEIQSRQQRIGKASISRCIAWAVLPCLMIPAGSWGQVQRDKRPTGLDELQSLLFPLSLPLSTHTKSSVCRRATG